MPPGTSTLISPTDAQALAAHLPPRCQGVPWNLLFSTARDGCSLATLYTRVRGKGPVLVTVLDEGGVVHVGFASVDLSLADRVASKPGRHDQYFGGAEAFVARLQPLVVRRATGANALFLLARATSLSFGGPRFAFCIDANLEVCTIGESATFESPEGGTPDSAFRIVQAEAWGFRGGASSPIPGLLRKGLSSTPPRGKGQA